jgi:hypothetical protein
VSIAQSETSRKNIEAFWNEKKEGADSWKLICGLEWDLIRSIAAKKRKQGDESIDKALAELLRSFRESHSQ